MISRLMIVLLLSIMETLLQIHKVFNFGETICGAKISVHMILIRVIDLSLSRHFSSSASILTINPLAFAYLT